MEGIKLYVRNAEESRLAQEKAGKLGLKWGVDVIWTLGHLSEPFLYFNNHITCGDDFNYFRKKDFKELSLTEWLDYNPSPYGETINCRCKPPFSHKPIKAIKDPKGYRCNISLFELKPKKKKWKKWEWSPCNNRSGEIKIKAPYITSHVLNFEGQHIKQILTIECSLGDIKVR